MTPKLRFVTVTLWTRERPLRLFADEDVYSALKVLLVDRGHDISSPILINLRGIGDEMCLLHAAAERRTIITHNGNDFELLHRAWLAWTGHWKVPAPMDHAGILVVPQLQLLDASTTAERVDTILHREASLENALYRLDRLGRWH